MKSLFRVSNQVLLAFGIFFLTMSYSTRSAKMWTAGSQALRVLLICSKYFFSQDLSTVLSPSLKDDSQTLIKRWLLANHNHTLKPIRNEKKLQREAVELAIRQRSVPALQFLFKNVPGIFQFRFYFLGTAICAAVTLHKQFLLSDWHMDTQCQEALVTAWKLQVRNVAQKTLNPVLMRLVS